MRYRTRVIRILQVVELALVGGVVGLVYLALVDRSWLQLTGRVSSLLGKLALTVFGLTLMPGISRRLEISLWIQRYLMPLRRHLGILMYLLALAHAILKVFLPNWSSGRWLPTQIPLSVLMGMLALVLTTPLFLTANDWAVNLLGRTWGLLHKLVYLVLFLVLLHVATNVSKWSILAGGLLGLEIVSWLAVWHRRQQQAQEVIE